MVKFTLTNIMGVPDTYIPNSKNSGNFGVVGLRQVMSTELPAFKDSIVRLEGTILSSTQDASGALYGEVLMNIIDVATDSPIAKVSMQASKDIRGGAWDINNASVSKTTNSILTNLKQTDEGFASTLLSVEEVVVKGASPELLGSSPSSGERVAVGLSESESVEVLSMAFEAIAALGAVQGFTNNYNVKESTPGETSYRRPVGSDVFYGSTLQNGQALAVTDSNHTRSGVFSQLAKYRTLTSNNCATRTYIPQNNGKSDLVFSTIAQGVDSKSTPSAFVTHTVPSLLEGSNVELFVTSVNTKVSNGDALSASGNLGVGWWAVADGIVEK